MSIKTNKFLDSVFAYLKNMRKSLQLLLFVLVFSVPAYIGIYIEFEYKVTKNIPGFGGHYARLEAATAAQRFINRAKDVIRSWTSFHIASDDKNELRNVREKTEAALRVYKVINLENLSAGWQIHSRYFYAHVQLICADIDQSRECLQQSVSTLGAINRILQSKGLSESDAIWLKRANMEYNLKILAAFVFAVQFKFEPDSPEAKKSAIDALKDIGDRDTLLDQNVDKDRLLGPIFRLID